MDEAIDSTHPDFWNVRYAAGKTPWDFRGIPEALKSFLARTSPPGAVLVPGCGTGYEIQAFHDAGYDVTAIDFSPVAVDKARQLLGPLAERVLLGDFFTHDFGQRRFDLIYERTFLCSLPPARWPGYAARMAELLLREGRLIGLFLYGQEPDPPPYPLTERQANELFRNDFRLVRTELVSDSLPLFRGMEKWQEWAKINAG
jgi:SAM-dependent methyltransferase